MIQLFKMAFRDLGRNKRRSLFSSLALGLGLACLLLMSAVLQGEMRDSMNLTIKLESGHLQVRAKSYEADRTSLKWEDLIENPAEVALKIAALDPVVYATPKLFASGIVTSGDEYTGVRVIGIDSASDAYAMFKEGMVSGEFPAADDREGLVIGKRLADNLNLDTGDVLNLMVNTSNGDVVEQPFTVRGIFAIQTPAYDDGVVFLPIAKAQAITQAENRASAIYVLLQEREQTESVAAALKTDDFQDCHLEGSQPVVCDAGGVFQFLYDDPLRDRPGHYGHGHREHPRDGGLRTDAGDRHSGLNGHEKRPYHGDVLC